MDDNPYRSPLETTSDSEGRFDGSFSALSRTFASFFQVGLILFRFVCLIAGCVVTILGISGVVGRNAGAILVFPGVFLLWSGYVTAANTIRAASRKQD